VTVTKLERDRLAHRIALSFERSNTPSPESYLLIDELRLKGRVDSIVSKRRNRAFKRSMNDCWDLALQNSIEDRFHLMTVAKAREVFLSLNYRCPSGKHVGGEVVVKVLTDPNACAVSVSKSRVRHHRHNWSGYNLTVTIHLDPRWCIRVWKKGMAVHNGRFVLSLDEYGRVDYVIKQGVGFNLVCEYVPL